MLEGLSPLEFLLITECVCVGGWGWGAVMGETRAQGALIAASFHRLPHTLVFSWPISA